MSASNLPMGLDVGVDPGVNTGFAVADSTGALITVDTLEIHIAMQRVAKAAAAGQLRKVLFEDARQRTWYGEADARQARSGPGIREGIGSVKRDCSIWEDFLVFLGVPFSAIKPTAGNTKLNAQAFAKLTGWTGRTSEHARDAGMLVFRRRRV